MNYSELMVRAGKMTWRTRSLWVLGFLAGLGSGFSSHLRAMAGLELLDRWRAAGTGPPTWINWLAVSATPADIWRILIGAAILIMVVGLLLWAVALIAQGGIIAIASGRDAERLPSLGTALKAGWSFVPRFAAIDTLVFFPLFLVVLVGMLVAFGGLLGTVLMAERGAAMQPALAMLAAALVCLVPLSCLLLPLGVMAGAFRTLAFRDAVLTAGGVRQNIKHTWLMIRRYAGRVVITLALLWGLQYLIGLVLTLVTLPLMGASIGRGDLLPDGLTAMGSIARGLNLVLGVLSLFLYAILNAFTATAWTMMYVDMIDLEAQTGETAGVIAGQ